MSPCNRSSFDGLGQLVPHFRLTKGSRDSFKVHGVGITRSDYRSHRFVWTGIIGVQGNCLRLSVRFVVVVIGSLRCDTQIGGFGHVQITSEIVSTSPIEARGNGVATHGVSYYC